MVAGIEHKCMWEGEWLKINGCSEHASLFAGLKLAWLACCEDRASYFNRIGRGVRED
jgi:hypothetical protein